MYLNATYVTKNKISSMSSVVPKHLTIVERDRDRYYINEHLMIRTVHYA